jgi:hypothetical protein
MSSIQGLALQRGGPVNKPHHTLSFRVSLQADLNTNIEDEGSSFYGVSSQYESPENMTITCSTKVCSFGKQVVEKVEVGGSSRCGAMLEALYPPHWSAPEQDCQDGPGGRGLQVASMCI